MALYYFNSAVVAYNPATFSFAVSDNPTVATSANFGSNNVSLGAKANGASVPPTGSNNSIIGFNAGQAQTSGFNNTFVGANAGKLSTTAQGCVFIGNRAGEANTIGNYNTFVGAEAGLRNTAGNDNSFFGIQAGTANTTGSLNVFCGQLSGNTNTTGEGNTYIGLFAGSGYTTGNYNTVIGEENKDSNALAGSGNTFIGALLTGYGAISNTVIVADGANNRAFTADSASFRPRRPIVAPNFTVATLPSAATSGRGARAHATNGRISTQTAGNGTGCPVYSTGTAWFTFNGNIAVTA